MLADIAKGLSASEPVYNTWFRYRGYYSNVKVFVPDPTITGEFCEERSSSIYEFNAPLMAEEKTAQSMIRNLEMNYGFETKDFNWWEK